MSDASVPVERLEQLANEWEREYEETCAYPPKDLVAEELRNVIDEYRGGDGDE